MKRINLYEKETDYKGKIQWRGSGVTYLINKKWFKIIKNKKAKAATGKIDI